jgi:copper transporter 1
MDHSHMDHSDMDMGASLDRCTMNMLFTWNTKNLCIVFRWWHIRSDAGLIFSLLAIVAITASYEALRSATRRYENWVAKRQHEIPIVTERTPFLWSGRNQVEVSQRAHVIKALLYAAQSFYGFMLMLLFMTYSGWVMIAMTVGAFVGYLLFGNNTSATKEGVCH